MPSYSDFGELVVITRMSIEWRIRDVLSLSGGSDDTYFSPKWKFGDEIWYLSLRPNRKKDTRNPSSGWLRLGIGRSDGGSLKTFRISVGIRGSGGVEKNRELERKFMGYGAYLWIDFCSRSELMEHKSRLMPDGMFVVSCVLKTNDAARGFGKDNREGLGPPVAGAFGGGNGGGLVASGARGFGKDNREGLGPPVVGGLGGGNGGGLGTPGTGENEVHKEKMDILHQQIIQKIDHLVKSNDGYRSEIRSYKIKITDLENKLLLNEKNYKERIQTSLDETSKIRKVNEQLKKEMESLKEQNKDLNRKCDEQTYNISKATSELREACTHNEQLKKEMESLMEQNKDLEMTVENLELKSENHKNEISTLESELISNAKLCKCQEKSAFVSGFEKAAFNDVALEENNGNNDDENDEDSKNKKNLKQLSQVKNTKKISMPARHWSIIRSLEGILDGGRRADFTLKSGGREWPVHRAILEGRSGHFETMFRVEWAERDEVRLDDIPEGALDGVLHFVYTGEVGDMSVENVCGIYVAAHRFLLADLKSHCVEYMKKGMCKEIVCGALAIAETYGEGDLKKSALDCYFRESDRILVMEEWKRLKENHPAIIAELLVETFKRKRSNEGQ